MSSFKKASKINQKVHRERHQPEHRAHLGFLEKKKDYKFRADDYNKKKKVLKKLKILALNRNPDEFHFHMVNSKIVDGQHIDKRKEPDEDTLEQRKLMENRNLTYVTMKRTMEYKKVNKLQSNLHLTDLVKSVNSTHVYFDENGIMEREGKSSAKEATFPLSKENLEGLNMPDLNNAKLKRLNKMKEKKYKSLAQRIERTKQLSLIQRKMEVHNYLKQKSDSKAQLVQQGNKNQAPVYLWKYERKR